MRGKYNFRGKWITACLLLVLLPACYRGTSSPLPQESLSPTAATTALAPTGLPQGTPAALGWITEEDQFGDGFIALVPIQAVEGQPPDAVLRRLVQAWLDHYRYDCLDAAFKLDDYSIGDTRSTQLDAAPYILVATIEYRVRQAQPGLRNAWDAGGARNEDGWTIRQNAFGYFEDGETYRLRVLFGWGT